MKKNITIILIISVLIGVICISCTDKTKTNNAEAESERKDFVRYNYTKEDIINNLTAKSNWYNIDEINKDNISEFSELLSYIDSIVGRNNYKVDKIYYTDYGNYNKYMITIVLNEYLEQYNNYTGIYSNPYSIMFTKDEANGCFNNEYYTFKLWFEYERDLVNELKSLNSNYEYKINYNTFRETDSGTLGVDENSTWYDALKYNSKKFAQCDMPSLYVIGDYSQNLKDMEMFVNNNNEVFRKYFVSYVTIIQLKKNEAITDYDNFNEYREEIYDKKYIEIK